MNLDKRVPPGNALLPVPDRDVLLLEGEGVVMVRGSRQSLALSALGEPPLTLALGSGKRNVWWAQCTARTVDLRPLDAAAGDGSRELVDAAIAWINLGLELGSGGVLPGQ